MKKVSIFILMIVCFNSFKGFSQENETESDQLDVSGLKEESQLEVTDTKEDRLKTNVELGTSFMYSPRNFYGPSYYIAPNLSYFVTPRFSLSAGIGFEYTSIYPLYNLPETENTMLPMTRVFLFSHGSYFLNESLMLTGTIYKSINDVPQLTQYSRPINYNYQGVDLGLQYQFNSNFSVGFHIRMNNMNYQPSGIIPPDALVPIPGF